MTTVVQSATNTAVVETSTKDLVNIQSTEVLVVDEHETSSVVLKVPDPQVVLTVDIPQVIQGGIQGPPGVPGTSTQFEYHVSGSALGGHRAVSLNTSGQLIYPDLTDPNSYVVGITTQSATSGDLVEIQITGTHTEYSWSWIPGQSIFVSQNGVLTQTPPTTGQVISLGVAATTTKIFIDKQPPIYIG